MSEASRERSELVTSMDGVLVFLFLSRLSSLVTIVYVWWCCLASFTARQSQLVFMVLLSRFARGSLRSHTVRSSRASN